MYYSPNGSLPFSLKKFKEYCVIFLSLSGIAPIWGINALSQPPKTSKVALSQKMALTTYLLTLFFYFSVIRIIYFHFYSIWRSNTMSWTNLLRCNCCIYFKIPIDAFNRCPPIFFYTQGARLSIRGSRRLPPLILFLFMIYFELSGREIPSFGGWSG